MIAGLKASDLPRELRKVFDGLNVAGLDQAGANQVLQTFNATAQFFQAVKNGNQVLQEQQTAYQSWITTLAQTREQLKTYDGSLSALQQLAVANQNRYQIELQLVQQISDTLKSSKDLFGGSIRAIRLNSLDQQGKADYFKSEANNLYGQLAGASDPTKINEVAKQLNQVINESYQNVGPDAQKTLADKFINDLQQVNDLVTARLNAVRQSITAQNDPAGAGSLAKAIHDALTYGAQAIARAAATPSPPVEILPIAINFSANVPGITNTNTGYYARMR